MREVDQKTGADLNPREASLPRDSLVGFDDAPRNPEAPWINPSFSNPEEIVQTKRLVYKCRMIIC